MSNNTIGSTKHTEQAIQNRSFDEEFNIATREIVGYDGANLQRIKVNTDGKLQVDASDGFDPDDDVTTNISIVGVVTTLTATNGTKTQTTVIDKTDPNDFDIIETWS